MANDLNLHRCITKMPHAKPECYKRTRLYFLVYICDHHTSLVYGKPSMTREFRTLKNPRAFLQSSFCVPSDAKLISQVELWSISRRVFDIFGADTEASITNERLAELESLGRCFDLCRSTSISDSDAESTFAQQLFDLYIHCAKLSLFSHTFRGAQKSPSAGLTSSPFHAHELDKYKRSTLASALAIVRAVAWGEHVPRRLEYLPSYFGTMIAFASVSLLKAWGQEQTMSYLDKNEVAAALGRLCEVLQGVAARIQPEHPLRSVARSLRIAMKSELGAACEMGVTPEGLGEGLGEVGDGMQDSVFGFGDAGGWGLEAFEHGNMLLPYAGDVHSGFFDFQNV